MVGGREALGERYTAVWFLLNGASHDLARFYRPDGEWTGYYADITEPITWSGSDPSTLSPIVDLFLDLWIDPAGSQTVLDEEEFEAALASGAISPPQGTRARLALAALLADARSGTFPPDIATQFVLGS